MTFIEIEDAPAIFIMKYHVKPIIPLISDRCVPRGVSCGMRARRLYPGVLAPLREPISREDAKAQSTPF